ncbi:MULTISPECIES: hypothetical protein [unclassified Enterococcus]|nr:MULTISPECIES: hypothetical protein [unclassified Enterococcus]
MKQVAYGYRNFLNFFVNTRICYT